MAGNDTTIRDPAARGRPPRGESERTQRTAGSPGTRENAPIIPAAEGTHGILRGRDEEPSAPGSRRYTSCLHGREKAGWATRIAAPAGTSAHEPFREFRHRCRAAEHGAVRLLRTQGFPVAVRVHDPRFPGHIIAWTNRGPVHLFRIVSSRRRTLDARAVAVAYAGEIRALMAVPIPAGGSRTLWVWLGRDNWRLYRIFPGGIGEVPHVA